MQAFNSSPSPSSSSSSSSSASASASSFSSPFSSSSSDDDDEGNVPSEKLKIFFFETEIVHYGNKRKFRSGHE